MHNLAKDEDEEEMPRRYKRKSHASTRNVTDSEFANEMVLIWVLIGVLIGQTRRRLHTPPLKAAYKRDALT